MALVRKPFLEEEDLAHTMKRPAIAEKAAAGKAISGGLVKEGDQLKFVVVVLSDDHVKEVFLEPPRTTSSSQPTGARKN